MVRYVFWRASRHHRHVLAFSFYIRTLKREEGAQWHDIFFGD